MLVQHLGEMETRKYASITGQTTSFISFSNPGNQMLPLSVYIFTMERNNRPTGDPPRRARPFDFARLMIAI